MRSSGGRNDEIPEAYWLVSACDSCIVLSVCCACSTRRCTYYLLSLFFCEQVVRQAVLRLCAFYLCPHRPPLLPLGQTGTKSSSLEKFVPSWRCLCFVLLYAVQSAGVVARNITLFSLYVCAVVLVVVIFLFFYCTEFAAIMHYYLAGYPHSLSCRAPRFDEYGVRALS